MSDASILSDLQARLDHLADPATKEWFERYLKYAVAYRGVSSSVVRGEVDAWARDHELGARQVRALLSLADALFSSEYAEDKFAATFLLQRHALKRSPPDPILELAGAALDDGRLADWSTVDWLCTRVLCGALKREPESVGRRLESWTEADVIWRRRASIVPFVGVVPKDDRHDERLARIIERLLPSPERFIQTAIGWTIASVTKRDPALAASWVELHLGELSREVIDRHTKRLPRHQEYRRAKRAAR